MLRGMACGRPHSALALLLRRALFLCGGVTFRAGVQWVGVSEAFFSDASMAGGPYFYFGDFNLRHSPKVEIVKGCQVM